MDLLKTIREGGGKAPMLVFSGTIPRARNVRDLAPYQVSGFINEYTTPTYILSALAPTSSPTASTAEPARGCRLGHRLAAC